MDRLGLKQLRLNVPRVKYWLAVGAQPSRPLRRLLANFNLLPLPPNLNSAPAQPQLMRALTGRGGAGEVKGKEEGQPGRQARAEWIYSSSKGVPYGQQRPLQEAREAQGEGSDGEAASSQAAPALRRFPFALAPTPVTFTAWQVAQMKYSRGVPPPPPAPTPPPLPTP